MASQLDIPRTANRPVAPPRERRLGIGSVRRGAAQLPVRALLYGAPGVGKTTVGASAPDPIFLDTEDGSLHLDVSRFPRPESFDDVLDAIGSLRNEEHSFRTLVIDTVDHLEPLVWAAVCRDANVKAIEDIPYGRGYVAATDKWRELQVALDDLAKARGMNTLLIAHAHVKPYQNPTGPSYDRIDLKLHKGAAGLLTEKADYVLYTAIEEAFAKDERTKRVRGISSGARLLHTQPSAAWVAKSRVALPDTIPATWDDLAAAISAGRPASADDLAAAIVENSERLSEADRQRAVGALGRAGNDPEKLAKLNDWIKARIALGGN